MNTPSIAEQLREMGHALPHPERGPSWRDKPKAPIGTKQRAAARREETYYKAFSERCGYKHADLWHAYNPAFASESGWPDFVVLGTGWLSFVEIKATSINTGLAGKLSVKQERWREAIQRAGAEYMVFTLPDDWKLVDQWLESKP